MSQKFYFHNQRLSQADACLFRNDSMTAVLVSLPKSFAPVINSERTSQNCLFHQSCIDIIIYIYMKISLLGGLGK